MSIKRMIIGLSVGAILGVVCIVGANLRSATSLSNAYLFAFWFNRFLMGFVFALLPFKIKLSHKIIRGIIIGLFISFAFYSATNYNDFTGFIVGGVYGIILELAIHYGELGISDVKKIKQPILFQGHLNKKNYFEGWYYKMVSPDGDYSLALIPGISLNKTHPHAFIQAFVTMNHKDLKTKYVEFPLNDFSTEESPFKLNINNNVFTSKGIYISINDIDISVNGQLQFENTVAIENNIFSPNIMGFFAYFKFMECYHGVVSMTHSLMGKMKINGSVVDFTGGKGYIEKDWGRSFPSEYVWMQSNHFKNNDTSLMFSEATIPFLGLNFHGLIVNLLYNGKEYRFATYNFSKVVNRDIESQQVYYEIKKRKLKLIIEAVNDQTISLVSPENGAMTNSIKEGLSGKIKIQLYKNNHLLYEDIGTHAGLEIMMK